MPTDITMDTEAVETRARRSRVGVRTDLPTDGLLKVGA
jgi:hypothetical protein